MDGHNTAASGKASHQQLSLPSATRGTRTHRGLTCTNCRLRKTRCDGFQPECKTCQVYRDHCRYEKPPPMSQIIAMSKRLQEAEQINQQLRDALDAASTTPKEVASQPDGPPSIQPGPPKEDAVSLDERQMADLCLDEHGQLCYHGPTSAVYEPAGLDARSADSPNYDEPSVKSDAKTQLTSAAIQSRAWEAFAVGNAGLRADIPSETIARLLQIHWTWISPTFNWVYRPAFMRDMAGEGPYYSPFLLIVMCAHAARFDKGATSDLLVSRARLLFGQEIHRPSSIPTVQALLQLSARDLAYGFVSQAWNYSGLAFRMASDLGLHQRTAKMAMIGNLGAEDLEVRTRLFWSCYYWDKAISLYLGRLPVLTEPPIDRSPELLDSSTEDDLWTPYQGNTLNLSKLGYGSYPPMKGHVVSCFQNSCQLAVIINDIIFQLYSRRKVRSGPDDLRDIKSRLESWRLNSPTHLRYDPENLPDVCPPPHILSQNLLYYTTIILLHRPFYSNPAHHATCRAASDAIEKLVLLLGETFGFTRLTYLMAYCVYTGASVIMQDVKKGDVNACFKMQTFLEALRQAVHTCPIVQRSLDIITGEMGAEATAYVASISLSHPEVASARSPRVVADYNNGDKSSSADRHDVSTLGNYLPAFPYANLGPHVGTHRHTANMDLDGFSFLDCFPENSFDSVNMSGENGWVNEPWFTAGGTNGSLSAG